MFTHKEQFQSAPVQRGRARIETRVKLPSCNQKNHVPRIRGDEPAEELPHDLVQPVDDLGEFFGARFGYLLADALDGEGADLADLHP